MSSTRTNRIKLILFLLLICAITVFSHVPEVREKFSIEAITSQMDYLGEIADRSYGPILFIVIGALILILHMPEIVVIIVGGLVYDYRQAVLYTSLGCIFGSTCTFLIGRFFLRDYFAAKLEASFLKRFVKRLEQDGIATMCMLRMILFLTPPLNWLIGATNISTRDYIIGNAVGIVPWLIAINLTIKELKTVSSIGDLFQVRTFAVMGAFLALFIAVLVIRKKFFSPKEEVANETESGLETR